ncbi:hypothetical protein H2202_008031 [Exophiala xenobiotica]|nr:hypothetical protein H2202_008031 [Exophiala xenobiotica]
MSETTVAGRAIPVWALFLLAIASYGALILYRLFISPLSRIPGPWLTRISAIPEVKALKAQRRTDWVNSLFVENPGAVAVRTGPNSVSFNHPDAVKAIYGHGKGAEGFGKSSWYDAFSTTGESLFSVRSKKRHATKRRMVAHGFSMQSLSLFEPYMDMTMQKFLQKMDEFASTQQPFDIYFWFELFTMDLMGELAFGQNFGALQSGKPVRYSKLVELSQRFANLSGMLPFGKYNVKVLSWVPIPYIQGLYQARLEYLDYARKALEKRFQDNRQQVHPSGKPRQDIMQRFIEAQDPETGARMDFPELRAEASSLMQVPLGPNPSVKTRIIQQLKEMFPENLDEFTPVPFAKLQHLSLLEATEIECLRLHPPIGYAMPRMTPASGAVICGTFIPGNVDVGVPAAIIGRNPAVYRDPDTWHPDRWLDEKADLSTMKLCFLGFGYGSRQCIGRNVANQFVMKMMATLLLRYDIQLEDPNLILGSKEFTIIKPDKNYNVILRPRKP